MVENSNDMVPPKDKVEREQFIKNLIDGFKNLPANVD